MELLKPSIELLWQGSFAWPGYESLNNLPSLPNKSSVVYLLTFSYLDGYLIYSAGLTRRSVTVRFREHRRLYLRGSYNVLDMVSVTKGIRKEIWHGWSYAHTHQYEFETNKAKIIESVHQQLASFHVFIVEIDSHERLPERLEAAIMYQIYKQPAPVCDIPDQGMLLRPRWSNESPVMVRNSTPLKFYGLPEIMCI